MLLDELMAVVDREAARRNHEVLRAVLACDTPSTFICAHAYHLSRLVKARKELARREAELAHYSKLWKIQTQQTAKYAALAIPTWVAEIEGEISELKSVIEDGTFNVSISERCGDCRACRTAAENLPPLAPRSKVRRHREPPLGDPENPAPYGRAVSPVLSPDTFEFIPEGGEGE